MNKTFIFGHKNPDTDSITSSLVMADFEEQLGNDNVISCRLGNINKETKYVLNYLGIEAPTLIEDLEDGSEIIIVDTSNPNELIPNLSNVKIKKIVDHHQVLISTSYPVFYRAEPVGCTETIMYKLYKEYSLEISPKIATLMLSAIISDTLLFKSPTCTDADKNAVIELSKIAGIDYEKYGMDMLKAGTDLSDYTAEQLINIDAKYTVMNENPLMIAQVNTVDIDDVLKNKEALEQAINNVISEKNLNLFVLAITDIVNSNSQIIALGNRTDMVEKAFNVKLEDNTAFLPGVVSRKKQMVPVLQENA